MKNDVQMAQFELETEINVEAAKIIRNEGIPLFDAIEIAKQRIRSRRQSESRYKGWTDNIENLIRK